MTLAELEAKLREGISDGRLELSEAATGIGAITGLLEGVAGDGPVVIRNARISTSDTSVIVEGRASILNVPELDVAATFVPADGATAFSLLGKLPSSWKFSQSFPDLPPSPNYAPDRFAQGLQQSFLDELVLSRPGFIFSTYAHRNESYGADLKEGLNFVAGLDMKGPLEVVGLLTGEQPLDVCGSIKLKGESAGLSLLAKIPADARLGPVTLENFGVTLHSGLSGSAPDAKAGIKLGTTVRLGDSVSMELATDIPVGFRGAMVLSGEFEDLTLPGLEALAELAGGDLSGTLPAGLQGLPELGITRFEINFSPANRTIDEVAFTLKTTTPWIVDPLTIKNISLEFKITSPLDKTKRLLDCTIFGSTTLAGADLGLFAALPEFQITAALAENQTINLSQFIREVASLPLDVPPELVIDQLFISANPRAKSFSFTMSVGGEWGFELGQKRLAVTDLSMSLERTAGPPPATTGYLSGTFDLGGTAITITGELGENFVLKATIPILKFNRIADELLGDVELPDEVPDLEFTDLDISVESSTGAFTLNGQAKATWDLPFGVPGLTVTTADIDLQKGASTGTGAQRVPGPISCSLKLSGAGPAAIAEGLVFNSFSFSFNLDGRNGWSLAGTVAATIFDAAYSLAAGLSRTPTQRTITLRAAVAAATPLVSMGDAGSLDVDELAVLISKALTPTAGTSQGTSTTATPTPSTSTTPSTTANTGSGIAPVTGEGTGSSQSTNDGSLRMSASSPYTWDVTATGAIKVPNVFTLAGTLRLYRTADVTGLAFKATNAQVEIPLPEPPPSMKLHLGLGYISVVRTTTSAGTSAWAFDAAADVWFTGLPKSIQKILAPKVVGRFKTDSTGTQVSVARVLQPLELELPDTKVGDANIEFGKMLLDASNLMLRLEGGNLTLSMDFGVGLPEKLNNVFGKKDDGTPSLVFFNTYVKGKPETVSKFKLGIDTVGGLTIQTVTSPIAAVKLVIEGQNAWWHVNLGEFGKAKLMVPVFSYTGDSFVARGGFQQLEPLKVPLTPFKLLLTACGLDAASKSLPAGIPLQEVQLYDEGRKDFNIDEFFGTLERLGGFTLAPAVKDALRFIEGRLDLLPNRFKSYLDIEIPERFEFNFAISPNGNASGKVWVQGNKPIKLLYPTTGPAGPQLCGIELYSLTFGEMLGGSLLLLRVDVRVDQFDLLLLAAALGMPLDQLPILPSTRALSQRFIVKDLFMLIVYQAGIPVPIPLFYDELGLEYLGLEGLEFQTHWGFPKPTLNPSEALKVVDDFKKFFTEHDYLLDANAPPQDFDLKLAVGPNDFQLPRYLGGTSLGARDDRTVIGAYESLAHMLNALKTLSLNEIVQAFPLDKRVGRERIAFACMALEIDWLVTTPEEFRSLSYRQLKVAENQVADILRIIPVAPGRDLQGLIIILKGSWQIADAFLLATCFGIIGTEDGFATGLSVNGKLSDLLTVQLSGKVVIDANGPNYFGVSGKSSVTILDHQLFTGDVQVDDKHFFLNGQLTVFPSSSPLQIGGGAKLRIDDRGQIFFRGATNVSLQNFVLQGSEITVTNTSLVVAGSWLGRTVTFSIVVQGRDFVLSGSAVVDLGLKFNTGPVHEPKTGLKLTDGIKLDTRANAFLGVSLGTFGFTAEVNAGFKWNELQLQVPQFRIAVSPADVVALANILADKIRERALEIFAGAYKSVTEWLRAGLAGVVQLSDEWREAVAAGRQWSAAGWNATAQWSTKAWQSAYRWKASAWRATTKWSEQAWSSTTQWSDDAWEATVTWSDDAWDATTRWSDEAWRATTGWSKDAWQATTRWSADTWRDTARWSKEVWDGTARWTTAEWNDAANTVEKFFKPIHGDVSFIPHIDTNFIPHGDAKLIPHADVRLIPHVDARAASHADVKLVPHGDVMLIPHADVKLIPHADFHTIPHGDVKGSHIDIDKKKKFGVTLVPHGDSRVGHIDTPHKGHVDTPKTAPVDTPSTAHIDTPSTAHLDTPNILHGDTPSTAHVDVPSTAHVDTPATAHGDTPKTAHIDSP